MNILTLINNGAQKLQDNSDSPRLDSNILLAYTLKMDRAKLLASYTDVPSEELQALFFSYIKERADGHPVAYILGEKEFYGYNFHIENGVLTPRPDTEILVETTLNLIEKYKLKSCLDMCTGTGCIALTIQLESQTTDVTAVDISPISKKVFKINNETLTNGKVKFIQSDLFSKLTNQKFDIIATNPPYLTKNETDERVNDGWKEPALALDGGDDGLDLIRTIIQESVNNLTPNGWLLIEAASAQMDAMKIEMEVNNFTSIDIFQDLAGMDRIIVGRYE